MFLRDACDQPVSSAWIGSICSRVALEKWSWHPCSPVSPPSSGQCSVEVAPCPLPFTAGCVWLFSPPCTPGHFWWPFAPHQSSVTLNWTEGKQSARSALCANLQLRCFSLGGRLAGSLHPTNTPRPAAEISSCPASARAIFCWRVPFFVVLQKFYSWDELCLTLWFSSKWKRELPCRVLLFPLSLLAVTHFLPTL